MQVKFISYLAGTLASLVICLFARYPFPVTTLSKPGGCLGTLYVWSTIFATPQIGAALTLALTIAGQMIAAVFIDHYGAIGLTKYPASPERVTGVVLVILGVSLVAYAKR
jgi:bacterial/archaeal transporter family-2 protein